MKSWDVIMIGTIAAGGLLLAANAWAQTADGVPGDRLVVPLPDISGLSESDAQDLTQELARMNVITSNCPAFEVSDPEWQLLNGTTDALTDRLDIDPLAYDREYFRPAFSLLEDPSSCDRLGPQVEQVIARLIEMGGDTRPVLPDAPASEPAAPTSPEPATPEPAPAPAD